MKKTFVYFATLPLLVFLLSCTKEQLGRSTTAVQPNQYINASVASGETFTFVAGSAGSLSINKQPLHFQVSEALNENGSVYYKYKPKAGYIGADEVSLMYVSDATTPAISTSSGCPASHNVPASSGMSTIVITLSVTK